MTLKVFEAFAGVGAQRMALRNLGIDHEVVAISEIDKFAIKSYEAIHGPVKNLGDITKLDIENVPDHDLFTYSFPCQDISVAGRQKGLDEDSDTRSSLLWHCRKIIEGKKPKYLLLENVKNLVGKRHKENFDKWLDWLEEQGYSNFWQVLNAKDYGIPQNRERVFVVSILGNGEYQFPKKQELNLRLKDLLENEVDEKFYLDNEKSRKLIAQVSEKMTTEIEGVDLSINAPKKKSIANCLLAGDRGISNHKSTGNGVLIKNATKKGYLEAESGDGIDLAYPESQTRRGRVQHQTAHTLTTADNLGVIEPSGLYTNDSPRFHRGTLSGMSRTLKANKHDAGVSDGFRIRKLTPLECWRLMGFTDEDFYKAQKVNSNSQFYKQAGNSIVVTVLEAIFKSLFKESE